MRLPIYQVDAFAPRVVAGNPAAIVPLETWLADPPMQAIAAENNLAETAIFVRRGDDYDLRWFTPEVQVDLCGHATLASAHVLFTRLGLSGDGVRFHTRSGVLTVTRQGERLALDLPARSGKPAALSPTLARALGADIVEQHQARDTMAVLASEDAVRDLAPDLAAIKALDTYAVIVTAPGRDCDFVSRFFAPRQGVGEDPVTGSAHCTLVPYWAKRLGRTKLFARQVSSRGGELWCEDRGERVVVAGECRLFLEGSIEV